MSLPAACVEEVHDTPLAPIWILFSDFGNWTKWFPLMENMRIINNKKGLGAIRKFETFTGTLYEEELVELNDSEHFLQYDLLSIKPAFPGVTRVKTTIKLEAISEKETKIHWSTALDLAPELDPTAAKLILGKAKALQESIFHIGIQALLQSIYINQYMKDVSSIFTDKAMTITRSLLKARSNVWEYADYPSHWGSLPKMVKGLPASEAIAPHKMGEMNGRILEVGYLQIANALKAVTSLGAPKKSNDIDFKKEYLNLAAYGHDFTEEEHNIAKRLVEKWDDDVEFCQQLLQGVNPLHIRMVRKMHEIPIALAHLTITEKSGEIKSLQHLVGEKRLFILDYRHLSDFVLHEKKFFYPAVMLVYRQILDENNSRLNVVGIQLDPTNNEIFTPDMPQKNRYKLARMFVACVDNQCHEFQYHLHAHLSMEPMIVAIHNRLPKASKKNPESKTHPLRALLEPHCKGTIGINFVARTFLISEEDNLTDKFFAVGTKQGVKLASKGWQNYHFFKSSFPEDLKARGFDGTDGVQNYLYRDYGFKLWNAIGDYTTDAVNNIYADDEAVKSDSDLQKWADEMSSRDGANITGFPETINTKKLLAHVLQIIIWHGSAFHSVLDFPQFTYIGLAYNRPSCFFSPMPELGEDGADIDDEFIQKSLSSKPGLLYKLTMSWLLSTPSEANLTDLVALKGIHDDVDVRFQENLDRISSEMKVRNAELEAEGKAPYIYLLPERVACSTDI